MAVCFFIGHRDAPEALQSSLDAEMQKSKEERDERLIRDLAQFLYPGEARG